MTNFPYDILLWLYIINLLIMQHTKLNYILNYLNLTAVKHCCDQRPLQHDYVNATDDALVETIFDRCQFTSVLRLLVFRFEFIINCLITA